MLVEAKSCAWVGHGSCLLKFKERYILAPSMLGPNLQLPAHKLIPPNSFYETSNKGKLSPFTVNIFPSGLEWHTMFAKNECINQKRKLC